MPAERRIRVRDNEDPFQRDAKRVTDLIADVPILNGVALTGVALDGPTRVYHRLGRPASGFIVTWKTADVNVWVVSSGNDQYFNLESTSPATINVWVY